MMVAGPGGALHLTWDEYTSGNYEIMYAAYSPGGAWSSPVNISTNAGDSTHPAAAVDHVGTVHVLWRDSSAARTDIFYASRAPDGVWSQPEDIHPSPSPSGAPAVVVDRDRNRGSGVPGPGGGVPLGEVRAGQRIGMRPAKPR